MFSSQISNQDILLSVYKDKRSVFRLNDIALLVGETNFQSLNKKLNYYVRRGKLDNPRKGIYTKPEYNPEELACIIYTPSYISLNYVLQKAGVVFQYDSGITTVSYLSRSFQVDETSDAEVETKIKEFHAIFEVVDTCEQEEIERAARTSIALDKLVEARKLGSLAYYYEGEAGNEYENIVTSVIAGNTLLTGKNIPVAGECEVKNAQAMKIMDAFGVGGSFSEFYAMEFKDDIVMLGHDGPAHFAIAEGKVQLVPLPLYHGKPGKGLSIQMRVKHGPVTILSVVEGKEEVFLLVAEGESVEGPILKIGNTNSRYRFPIGAREFINQWSKQGPANPCAIGVGHIAEKIEKLGHLVKIKVVKIC